jgi:putative transposase
VLYSAVGQAAEEGIKAICGSPGCEVVEMNVQSDHMYLTVMLPPKLAISDLMGRVKGQIVIKTLVPKSAGKALMS